MQKARRTNLPVDTSKIIIRRTAFGFKRETIDFIVPLVSSFSLLDRPEEGL